MCEKKSIFTKVKKKNVIETIADFVQVKEALNK